MYTRSFVRYLAKITINIKFPGFTDQIFTDIEFIAPFALRTLEACVRPWNSFPRKYVNIDVSYEILDPSIPNTPSLQTNPFVLHNYTSIQEMILRNVIYCLGFEYCLTHSYENNF